jgi:hypothetical protein
MLAVIKDDARGKSVNRKKRFGENLRNNPRKCFSENELYQTLRAGFVIERAAKLLKFQVL